VSGANAPSCHALVTGGGRGIGLAIARALTDRGASVSLLGRTEAVLAAACEALGPTAAFAVADVTDDAALSAAVEGLSARRGVIDILVNNAGGADTRPMKKMRSDDLRRMLEWNVVSAQTAIAAVLPGMLSAGRGRIVNIASTAGLKGYAYVAHYCAAKHALIGLTRAAAVELARTGITVNAVCPGYTQTDMLESSLDEIVRATGRTREEAREALVAANPMRRAIAPEEVADAVAWLCGPAAGAVTGQAIVIAGGEL
jgi:NAD(P)-dependent dehydrogenase (short-subunit alcohol dehydrogenase family)